MFHDWSSIVIRGLALNLDDVRALAVNPNDHERLYAATATGIWVSSDGGRRWGQPPDGLRKPAARLALVRGRGGVVMVATEDGIFVGDAMARHWQPADSAPDWWGPLVAFTFESAGSHVIAVSHEGVVASRRIAPLSEALSGQRAVRRE